MSELPYNVGDIVDNFYVYKSDEEINSISLTQFRPLDTYNIGEFVEGYVRRVLPYGVFIDIGCEIDAFMHKSTIEVGLRNRMVF